MLKVVSKRRLRFVQLKSEASQGAAIVFRARDLLVRQRTQVINALPDHLAEFGFAQAQDQVQQLPEAARPVIAVLVETLRRYTRCTIRSAYSMLRARRAEDAPAEDDSVGPSQRR